MTDTRRWLVLAVSLGLLACRAQPASAPLPVVVPVPPVSEPTIARAAPMLPQNPSPMQEHTRRHERLVQREDVGVHVSIEGVLPKSVDVFIPQRVLNTASAPLVLHFMGATWLPQRAVASIDRPAIIAATNLGAGSSVYSRPFAADTLLYERLVDTLRARIAQVTGAPRIEGIYLTGFSAGYGAIREILRRPANFAQVDGVLLMDGIHTGYIPDRKLLADSGALDTTGLGPFAEYARLAVAGSKRFVITHSEIFPGTFASTTECTDWLLATLGIRRVPVLEWGPMGMQLLSRTINGRFEVLGFAGNSGPDHIDQFHGMAAFVGRLLAP
jgi:hypothetical protein